MKDLMWVFISVLLGASAQLCLKKGMTEFASHGGRWIVTHLPTVLTRPFILLAFALISASATLWLVVLSKKELSYVYPMVALAYVYTAVAAYFLWHENLNAWRIGGIALICLGVSFVAKS